MRCTCGLCPAKDAYRNMLRRSSRTNPATDQDMIETERVAASKVLRLAELLSLVWC